MKSCGHLLIQSVLALSLLAGCGETQPSSDLPSGEAPLSLLPRKPIAKAPIHVPDVVGTDLSLRLVVKLVDSARGRATESGALRSLSARDLSPVSALAKLRGLRFAPLIRLPEATLLGLKARAERASGVAQPDLSAILAVTLDDESPANIERVGSELLSLALVEYVHVELGGVAPAGDIAPPTPDLVPVQAYRGPNPGFDVDSAWSAGYQGATVRLSDCEYAWNGAHEDLVDIDLHPEPGQTPHPQVFINRWDQHGAGVLGITSAPDNGYGVSGAVPGAPVYTYPEWSVEEGLRRATSLASAIADSAAGDVVMVEMQTAYPSTVDYVPAEVDPTIWAVTSVGSAAGVILVAGAGNGNRDLDSATYAAYQALGDSGALIVGAGMSDLTHTRVPISTYGSRVNVQGWGQNAVTLGNGNYANYGPGTAQRYGNFGGTCAATAMVGSAAVAVQEAAKAVRGAPLAPLDLRAILFRTGSPQGAGGNIGPMVNLGAAIPAVQIWMDLGYAHPGGAGAPTLIGAGAATPGSSYSLTLSGGAPNATAIIISGASSDYQPFFGGIRVPKQAQKITGKKTDAAGNLVHVASIPPGFSPGASLVFQVWLKDPTAVGGYSATNGVLVAVQ